MNRAGIFFVVGALCSFSAAAQSHTSAQSGAQASGQASAQAGQTQAQAGAASSTSAAAQTPNGQTNASLASGTAFNAALSSPLDTRKCTPGDTVRAHATEAVKSEGKTVIPKGSKLLGHVTQASARANGQADSALGIVFDKAVLKSGQEVPLNVAIQALASGQSSASAAGADLDTVGSSAAGSASSGGRGALGGVTSTAGAAAGTVTNTAGRAAGGAVNSTANAAGGITSASKGAVGGLNSAGQLTSNSQGVFGLNGLNLNAAASNATEGSVITSAGKSVHLDSGTRMLLVTQAQAGEQPATKQPAAKPESKPEPNKPEKP